MRLITEKNKSILREMVVTDFKVRYQGSILGYAWSVLRPLFMFAILYVVFTKFLKIGGDIEHYPVYLLFGVILWSYFAEATQQAMTSIVRNGELIKKISIPRYLVVLSSTISALINLVLNLIILLVIAFISGVDPMKTWLLVPLFIAEIYIFSTALGFFLSALFVKYRDASYVWDVLLQAGFYATPILYPLTIVAEKFHAIIMINPIAQMIQDSRWAFVSHDTLSSWKVLDMPLLLLPLSIVIFSVFISIHYFKKESYLFAERI